MTIHLQVFTFEQQQFLCQISSKVFHILPCRYRMSACDAGSWHVDKTNTVTYKSRDDGHREVHWMPMWATGSQHVSRTISYNNMNELVKRGPENAYTKYELQAVCISAKLWHTLIPYFIAEQLIPALFAHPPNLMVSAFFVFTDHLTAHPQTFKDPN